MDEQVADDELLLTIPVSAGVPYTIVCDNNLLIMDIPLPSGTGGGEVSSIFFF